MRQDNDFNDSNGSNASGRFRRSGSRSGSRGGRRYASDNARSEYRRYPTDFDNDAAHDEYYDNGAERYGDRAVRYRNHESDDARYEQYSDSAARYGYHDSGAGASASPDGEDRGDYTSYYRRNAYLRGAEISEDDDDDIDYFNAIDDERKQTRPASDQTVGIGAAVWGLASSWWQRYLHYYRRSRIRGIGTVGIVLCLCVSLVLTFRFSPTDYMAIIKEWLHPTAAVTDNTETVSAEEPESGFNITVKFTTGTICSEPDASKKIQNTVMKGQVFEVLETSGDFYRIEYLKNCFGWIDKYYVDVEGHEEPKVIDPHHPEELTGSTATELKNICQKYSAMGVGVAVIRDGKVEYTYSYGYANRQQKKKINADTKFRPASLSKIISTLSTMTLVDAGRIDLDRNVENYFGFKFRNPLFPQSEITPRMLLNHSSSLDDEYIIYTGSNAGTRLKDLVIDLKSYKDQKPGTEFSYSNSGFGIVGSLDEVVTNMHYIYFTDSVLFDRLSMDAAFGGQSLQDKTNVAECYKIDKVSRSRAVLVKDRQIRAPGETYILAQGSLLISPKDYAKLVTIFINDGMYGNIRVLSEAAVREVEKEYLHDDQFRYCLGFKKTTAYVDGHDLYYHGGNAYGVYASVCYDEQQKSGVVVMTSGAYGSVDDYHFYKVCQTITQQCYKDLIDK